MKKLNQKGLAEIALLGYVIGALILFFVPNPVSSAVGIGIRPNKTVEKASTSQKVEFVKRDLIGRPVAEPDGSYLTRTTVEESMSSVDKQQKVSLWEQLRNLPVIYLILIFFGVAAVPSGGRLWVLYKRVKKEIFSYRADTRKIVVGVDRAFATIPKVVAGLKLPGEVDRVALAEGIEKAMKTELGDTYNDSTKALVKSIREPKETQK